MDSPSSHLEGPKWGSGPSGEESTAEGASVIVGEAVPDRLESERWEETRLGDPPRGLMEEALPRGGRGGLPWGPPCALPGIGVEGRPGSGGALEPGVLPFGPQGPVPRPTISGERPDPALSCWKQAVTSHQ